MKILPEQRPEITKKEALDLASTLCSRSKLPPIFWLGIRGYSKNSLYPDAICIVADDEFITFNGNTDPSLLQRGVYNLLPGVYHAYKFDNHKGAYMAFCQRAAHVDVVKNGKKESGMFGINIHRGGSFGGSLSGSHTIPPSQWEDFITSSMRLAKRYDKDWASKTYTYILIEL